MNPIPSQNGKPFSALARFFYTVNQEKNVRVRRFLGGLISYSKRQEDKDGLLEKEIRCFGLPGLCKGYRCGFWEMSVGGWTVIRRDARVLFEKRYRRFIPSYTDHIYILNSNLGEAYCFLAYLSQAVLKRDKSVHPVFWVTRRYLVNLAHLFFPQRPVFYIGHLKKYFKEAQFACAGVACDCIFSAAYFAQNVEEIANQKTSYLNSMLQELHLSLPDLITTPAQVAPAEDASALSKLRALGWEQKPFVFIAPEVNTCQELSLSFWQSLVSSLQASGLYCFINLTRPAFRISGAATLPLSLGEALSLASRAQFIITLRSGLSELLLQAKRPMYTIYTPFTQGRLFTLDASQVHAGFSLAQLPVIEGQKKIGEYIYSSQTLNQLIKDIEDDQKNMAKKSVN